MGQEEVLNVLTKKEFLTTKEIAEILNVSISSASACLRRLVKGNEVIKKKAILKKKYWVYIFKVNSIYLKERT